MQGVVALFVIFLMVCGFAVALTIVLFPIIVVWELGRFLIGGFRK
jgi:hypothetical protein